MIKVILFDLSRVLINAKDDGYKGKLNDLYKRNLNDPNFKFFNYFSINEELLEHLRKIKIDLPLYIFTTDIIQNEPILRVRLNEIFTKIYSAKEIGFTKDDPKSYLFISNDIGCEPNDILFIDDSLINMQAAAKAQMTTIHFQSNGQILGEIHQLLHRERY